MNCKVCLENYNNSIFNNGLCKYCDDLYYWCEKCNDYTKSPICSKCEIIKSNTENFYKLIFLLFLILVIFIFFYT